MDIKLTWRTDRNHFEGIYMNSDKDSGIFYIQPVKELDYDINKKLEDILEDIVVIYSRDRTQTTLMKCKYKGHKAVAKHFIVDSKEKAQSIIDSEVRFQSYFKDEESVV